MRTTLKMAILCLITFSAAGQDPLTIERVSGGAILKTRDGNLLTLYGILCESTTITRGQEAKVFTSARIVGKDTRMTTVKELAGIQYVKVMTEDGADLSRALLEAGLAKWDRYLWPELTEFEQLEKQGMAAYEAMKKSEEAKGERERMSVRSELDKAEAMRQEAIVAEKWQGEVKDWVATPPDVRKKLRTELLARHAVLERKFSTAAKYYDLISYVESIVTQHAEIYGAIREDYERRNRNSGRSLRTEIGLRDMEWEDYRANQTLETWIAEYNRLASELDIEYPAYERDAQRVARLDENLSKSVLAKEQPDPAKGRDSGGQGGAGTGFVVASETLLTCQHVVSGAASILVRVSTGTSLPATIIDANEEDDWCLLSVPGLHATPMERAPHPVKLGSTVYNLGFPLGGRIGAGEPVVGKGDVASLAGFDGDARHIQVTFPVNGGSSGSPVLDEAGAVVGMVTHKFRDSAMLAATGTTAQGINYALKLDRILTKAKVGIRVQKVSEKKPLEEVAKRLRGSIFLIVTD